MVTVTTSGGTAIRQPSSIRSIARGRFGTKCVVVAGGCENAFGSRITARTNGSGGRFQAVAGRSKIDGAFEARTAKRRGTVTETSSGGTGGRTVSSIRGEAGGGLEGKRVVVGCGVGEGEEASIFDSGDEYTSMLGDTPGMAPTGGVPAFAREANDVSSIHHEVRK
jgi:hypothetical protein